MTNDTSALVQSSASARDQTLRSPIVGAHFRPPARLVLAALAGGTTLRLEPEPENPYDPNAIKVLVCPEAVPESQRERLAGELPNCGWSLELLLAEREIQLGYVCASTNAKALAKAPGTRGNVEIGQAIALAQQAGHQWAAALGFGIAGEPQVVITICQATVEAESAK